MKSFVQLALDWLDIPAKMQIDDTEHLRESQLPAQSLSVASGIARFHWCH